MSQKTISHPKRPMAIFAMLLVLAVGGFFSSPVIGQDPPPPPEIEECEVDRVTTEDGKICLYNVKCPDMEAKKLCFKFF